MYYLSQSLKKIQNSFGYEAFNLEIKISQFVFQISKSVELIFIRTVACNNIRRSTPSPPSRAGKLVYMSAEDDHESEELYDEEA